MARPKFGYESLKQGRRRNIFPVFQHEDDDEKTLDKTTARKLFSYLLCHEEDCRLELPAVIKRLTKFSGRNIAEKEALDFVKSCRDKFQVKTVDGKKFIEATTKLALCDRFQEGKCRNVECEQLHACRFFLKGSCKFDDKCKKPHTFDSPQTMNLLAQHKLNKLPPEALQNLFKKVLNDKIRRHAAQTSGPEPCNFYNKGTCKNGDKCEFLHVCEHYINGDCKFGERRCKRLHHFDTSHSRKVLAAHSLGHLRNESEIISNLRSGGRSTSSGSDNSDSDDNLFDAFFHHLSPASTKVKPRATSPSSTSGDKTEICGFNLRSKCNYGDKCNAHHASLPYQWEYSEHTSFSLSGSNAWKSFLPSENKKLEKEFCNVDVSSARATTVDKLICTVDFQAMAGRLTLRSAHPPGSGALVSIRRLSTISSVVAPSGHVFATKWRWFWKDEHDKWHSYDEGNVNTSSEKIEQDYLSVSGEKKHAFSSGSNKYVLHMGDPSQLYQQNEKYRTKREVRRRPTQFVDEAAMKQMLEEFKRSRQRASSSSSTSETSSVPAHWAPLDPSEEFKLVKLNEVLHYDEIHKVKTQFLATMSGYTVKSIERVQNSGLWEDYERQKSKITKKNPGNVLEERWLFHGTSKETLEPICQQGFDWRLSGKHGTRFGKGSYFAAEANYSNNYSKNSDGNPKMFLAKVIVGSFVVGSYETQRPPAKDPSDPLSPLYDSCVNNLTNPSIFVIFERSQAYPYYIIHYGK